MKRIGLHRFIRQYRQHHGISPFQDDNLSRDWGWRLATPISHLISDCAMRAVRSKKNLTIGEWNDLVEKMANDLSGNPQMTLRALTIRCLARNKNKPVVIEPHYMCPHPKRFFWSGYSDYQTLARGKKLKAARERRIEIENKSCTECGAQSIGTGFMAVMIRWDVLSFLYGHEWKDYQKHGTPLTPFTQKEKRCNLCVKCWNRITPIIRKKKEAQDIQNQINQLKKELKNGRTKHDRQDSRIPDRCSGTGAQG